MKEHFEKKFVHIVLVKAVFLDVLLKDTCWIKMYSDKKLLVANQTYRIYEDGNFLRNWFKSLLNISEDLNYHDVEDNYSKPFESLFGKANINKLWMKVTQREQPVKSHRIQSQPNLNPHIEVVQIITMFQQMMEP